MIIKLKANIPISPEFFTHIGNITIKNSEIVKFEKTENSQIIEFFSNYIFPIKRSEFEIKFLDEFDDEFKMFNAFINIKDSLNVRVKLSYIEKIKLKWMLKKYLIQSKEIKIELLKYLIIAALSFIGGIIYQRKNLENNTPNIPSKDLPKPIVNNSLGNKSLKNSIKKDTITLK